jgi:hypothetical protein
MRTPLIVVALPLALLLPACRMNERLSGTLIGAGGGAVVGAVTTGFPGFVVGGLAGGLAGYLVGDYMADQRERGRTSVFKDRGVAGVKEVAPTIAAAEAAYEKGRAAQTSEEAKRWYRESLRLDPERPGPWNALGLHAYLEGDRALAETHFRQALAVEPDYYAARYNLARLAGERAR